LKNQHLIRIRATQHGVSIVCDPHASFADLAAAIRARLQSHAQFYKNAEIKLNLGDRGVNPQDLEPIRTMLETEFQLRLSSIVCSQEALLHQVERALGCPVELLSGDPARGVDGARSDPAEGWTSAEPALRTGGETEETVIVRQTCRSGMTVSSPGSIVVLGNVNPGADVIAERDIIVMGVLRGNAHAGASGDTSAVVIALALEPKQLRIADHLGLPPSAEGPISRPQQPVSPEVAYIEGNQIVIEPYTGRFPVA
jgi:septum site-determining protein MinC